MALDPTLYYTLLGISTLVTGWMAYYAWKKRRKAGRTIFLLYFLIWLWSASTLAMVATPSAPMKYGFLGLVQVSYLFAPMLWLLFVLEFTGREHYVTRRNAAALLVVPVAMLFVYLTNPLHHTFIESFEIANHYYTIDVEFGAAHDALNTYNFALLLGAIVVLGDMLRSPHKKYRRHAAMGIVATLAPWVAGVIYLYTNMEGNPVPIGFAFTGVLVAHAVFYEGYLDIVPVARDTVVDRINNGVLVVDEEGKVVDINESARWIFGLDEEVMGEALQKALSGHPDVYNLYREMKDEEGGRREFSIQEGDGNSYFQLEVTPLYDEEVRVGSVLMVNDITEQRRREERIRRRESDLEQQNKRLDKFASIVSHDLRNPLNVAQGYTSILEEEMDGRNEVEHIREAQERMQTIIDDALTLAREGYEVTQKKQVSLGDAAREAWDNVDAGDSSLEVEADTVVNADRNKLLNVFENLYRNAVEHGSTNNQTGSDDAVEHGGSGVRVRVGVIRNSDEITGFYVEDDGPGIPEDEREDVFEQGYSSDDGGTGLGLSIVKTIVDAHDWSARITEGSTGGARIEVTGIEQPAETQDQAVPD